MGPIIKLQSRSRTYLAAAGVVGFALVAAAAAAVAMDRITEFPVPLAPVAAAVVVAAIFAWRCPEGLVAFGLFALLAETIEHWAGIDLLLFDEISVLLLSVIAVVRHGIPNGRLRIGVAEVAIFVLVASAIASSLVAGVPIATWTSGFVLLFKAIAFFYIVSWLRLSLADARRMGVLVLGAAIVIGVLGLIEFLDPLAFQRLLGLPAYDNVRGEVAVVRSIFLHPAQYGWLTAFASLFLYARFLTMRSWWSLPVALMLNVGTILSGRRTPVIGVLIGLGVGLAWQMRHLGSRRMVLRTWLPIGAVVVLLTALSLPVLGGFYRSTIATYVPPMEKIEAILDERPDAAEIASVPPRTALYIASIAVARDHLPLGAGLGRFGSHLSRVDYSPLYREYGLEQVYGLGRSSPVAATDTFWPMILGETGVIGLAAALTFFVALLVALWRTTTAATMGEERALALGALLIYAEGLVRTLTSATFVAPPIAYFLLGAAGLSIAVRRTESERAADDGRVPKPVNDRAY